MSSAVVIAAAAAALLVIRAAVGQGKHREQAADGPFRVVLSDPVTPLAQQAGKLYREHEYLSAMFNQLDKDGLVPVSTELLRVQDQQQFPVERLLVVCKKR
ncbi:MAG: hypothetical protein H6835_09585 [Planctomycetes bacterium]|nr:hypothetical protein [Planctomycetota bacterium]